jgi:hypothetical protein
MRLSTKDGGCFNRPVTRFERSFCAAALAVVVATSARVALASGQTLRLVEQR